jgi:hypothetical protein
VLRARLPRWLYFSYDAGDVLRTRVFGSRRTVLHLMLLSARDGWRVWIWAALGWTLTFGGEDPVAEGRICAAETCPGHRHRILRRFPNGKVLELAYAPKEATHAG